MLLTDHYLPDFQFSETHSLEVAAPPARLMQEVLAYRPEDDRFFRQAIRLRELPMRLLQRRAGGRQPSFGMSNFTLLQCDGSQEVVYGLAGRLWKADFGQVELEDGEAFRRFSAPGCVKLVVAFTCHPLPSGKTRLTTQTRVHCIDRQAAWRFAPYWYLIRPVSGIIRRRLLRSIAQRCDEDRPSIDAPR